jgi:RNA polymerase sigma-70 factor (ECF subfamily)
MTVLHPVSAEEERSLIERMRAGDERAFQWFAEHYAPALYRFASERVRHEPELVRDVVQTALCRFMEKLDSYRGESAIFTWLCAVCRNEIAGHFRRANRAGTEFDDASERESDIAQNPETGLLARENEQMVHLSLDAMPPRYARILEWKYVDGLSVREIAQRLDVSEKATESLLTRARTAFRATFEEIRGGSA